MSESIELWINGVSFSVPKDTTVAAALLSAGVSSFRRSVTGEPRGPLCGIGICFECRVTIDDEPHCRSCQTVSRQGMDIRTDG